MARTNSWCSATSGSFSLTDPERRDLLEVLNGLYGKRATLVTSRLPFDHRRDVLGYSTVADAVLDRLVPNAHRITLQMILPCGDRRPTFQLQDSGSGVASLPMAGIGGRLAPALWTTWRKGAPGASSPPEAFGVEPNVRVFGRFAPEG